MVERTREKVNSLKKKRTQEIKTNDAGLERENKFCGTLRHSKGTGQKDDLRGRKKERDKTQEDREGKSEVVRARVWPSAYRK